ncbi:MAG: hypothetical protein R8K20_01350 [Gallionellaceae bacterium]
MVRSKKRLTYDAHLDDADSAMLFGAQGTGKGYRTKELCSIETRLIVWDSMENWQSEKDRLSHVIYGDLDALKKILRARKRFRISFIPDLNSIKQQFDTVCKLVFAHGRMCFMADELDEVTTASHAPAAWRSLTGRGRHRGIHLRGNGQRPAEVDKRAITNATQVMVGRLTELSDLKALRSKFGEHVNLLPGFPDGKQLLWVSGDGVYLIEKNGKRKRL